MSISHKTASLKLYKAAVTYSFNMRKSLPNPSVFILIKKNKGFPGITPHPNKKKSQERNCRFVNDSASQNKNFLPQALNHHTWMLFINDSEIEHKKGEWENKHIYKSVYSSH